MLLEAQAKWGNIMTAKTNVEASEYLVLKKHHPAV